MKVILEHSRDKKERYRIEWKAGAATRSIYVLRGDLYHRLDATVFVSVTWHPYVETIEGSMVLL